ncbi:Transcription factor TGA like domain [Arabidopsis thaliana x Arabidopsis arenosa]|uniref:Transcription factor TGA like domain n=1 Tax=Arabidopsis thaliana x Arabidopsis arenosa TaxID=1240361 RepID=A0A8T1Y7X9_9BRAS|nr:Transcription factor TGA like domain [Arabidopsis thaliana x Arabidopsis arenosa]
MESSSSYGVEKLQERCYKEWMGLQTKHIDDLKEALMCQQNKDHKLEDLVGKIVNDFKTYAGKRSELSHRCCANYFAPSWNSPIENSMLWMGGCRPSSFIRLIYALCGSQAETQLSQYLHKIDENFDVNHGGSMSDLTATQLGKINELHMKVIKKEDKITKTSANFQEDVADMPIADVVHGDAAVDDALDKHEEGMAVLLAEADKLRFETLRKIVEVVTPVQAAEFLLAGKRLQLSLHERGRVRAHVCGGVGDGAGKSDRTT